MTRIYTTDLKDNQVVNETFLILQKGMPSGKSGKPYLSLRLGDKKGEVEARLWDNAPENFEKLGEHNFVRVEGRTQTYQDRIQINIRELHPVEASQVHIDNFLPITQFNIDEMYRDLLALIKKEVEEPDVSRLMLAIFEDPEIEKKFKRAPAAKTMHHAFIGGLLEHELGLARLAVDICKHYPHIEKSYVIAGCLLHDLCKIDELSYETRFDYTDEGKFLGHLVMGIELVGRTVAKLPNFPKRTELLVKHLIASHHGSLEFGSPKVPVTLEAILVHYLDDMDSKLQAMKGHIDKEWDTKSKWTTYHRLFDRFMYKGTKWETTSKTK